MDVDGFVRLLERIEAGEVDIVARDLASPSPLSHAILNARPYAFLDDGAAEERRTKTVATKALMDLQTARDIARLDPEVIAQARADARPEVASADELHDALCVHGFLAAGEVDLPEWMASLAQQRRATQLTVAPGRVVHVAAERLHESSRSSRCDAGAAHRCGARRTSRARRGLARDLRGRLDLLGPVTAAALAEPLGLSGDDVRTALLQLEADGTAMRGAYTAPHATSGATGGCSRACTAPPATSCGPTSSPCRRLSSCASSSAGTSWRPRTTTRGARRGRLADVLRQLEGHAAPHRRGKKTCSPRACRTMRPRCSTSCVPSAASCGGVRAQAPTRTRAVPSAARRSCCASATRCRTGRRPAARRTDEPPLSGKARAVRDALRTHGASFFSDLQRDVGLLGEETSRRWPSWWRTGLVTCDTFAGLRALVMPADKRNKIRRRRPGPRPDRRCGRWSLARRSRPPVDAPVRSPRRTSSTSRACCCAAGACVPQAARARGGPAAWRDLHYVYRRLERAARCAAGAS
jgi:ATP-dependent Lhr-like helicase